MELGAEVMQLESTESGGGAGALATTTGSQKRPQSMPDWHKHSSKKHHACEIEQGRKRMVTVVGAYGGTGMTPVASGNGGCYSGQEATVTVEGRGKGRKRALKA